MFLFISFAHSFSISPPSLSLFLPLLVFCSTVLLFLESEEKTKQNKTIRNYSLCLCFPREKTFYITDAERQKKREREGEGRIVRRVLDRNWKFSNQFGSKIDGWRSWFHSMMEKKRIKRFNLFLDLFVSRSLCYLPNKCRFALLKV